jgi:hypothetical protein
VCLGLLANHIIAALGDAGSNRWKLELALPVIRASKGPNGIMFLGVSRQSVPSA